MVLHETLRTHCFREQMASPEVSREGKFEPEPLYLKHFSDAEKIALEADSDAPESGDLFMEIACSNLLYFPYVFDVF